MTSLPSDVLDGLVASGRESGGAVAVVRDGVIHVEHAAGTCQGAETWALNTLVMTFSVAKPLAAWAFLGAVAEGHLDLDQTVVSVWPAFGQAGKEDTTLRHLLAHQAGLPAFPEEALEVEYDDREALVDLLARQAPIHRPGAGVAEHALTYGHLLDEVVRRATGEQLADRFARIVGETWWDLHLRVADHDLPRVATVVDPDGTWRAGYLADPRWGPALGRPRGLLEPDVLNSDRFRRTSFSAVARHATARGLALFDDDVIRPDGRVADRLGHGLWRAYSEPASSGHDVVLDQPVTWTLGVQISDEETRRGVWCSAWEELAAAPPGPILPRGTVPPS